MLAGILVRIVTGRFEMFRVLMWSRCGRGRDLSLPFSDKDLVTVEYKASLLNNYLTINAGNLKLELLMGRWTGGGPFIERFDYV